MKHFKHLFTALLLLCATIANAYDIEYNGIYYNITDYDAFTVEVTSGYNEYTGSVTIPEKIIYYGRIYRVTSIRDRAFSGCSSLTSIEIPNSVTSIGSNAFRGCSSLTSIEIPNSVTSIGSNAFSGCSSLTSIEIPNSVTSIGESAFYDCSGLTSITIGNSVTSIGDYAFRGCSSLTSITIGNSVTSIGDYAFRGCSSLTSVTIGNSVTSIGDYAFYYCTGLTSIEIPNSVTSIGNDAFCGCSGLTSVTIGNSVTSIGEAAFLWCENLKEVINLSNLTISKDSSGNGYAGYYADKVINIPNGFIEGDFIFKVVDGVNVLCNYLGNDTEIILPENYKGENYVINEEVFKGNTVITSITISASVTDIADNAFQGCTELKKVELNCATIGCWFSGNTSIKEIVLGNNVVSIADNAFRGCAGLASLTVGSKVANIGYEAFYGCNNLKEVINLSNLTISKGSSGNGYVGYYADKVINVPNGLIEGDFILKVVDGVNVLCNYLGNDTEIVLPENYKGENYVINEEVFKGNTAITSITIPASVTDIAENAFQSCTELKKVELNCATIGCWFSGNTSIKEIVLGNNVVSIADNAFRGCAGLASITIPNSVTSIGSYAFENCSCLTSIEIPNSVTRIGRNAFDQTDWYNNQPNGAVYVGNVLYCYKGTMPENTCIEIKKETVDVADYAFYGCSNLTSIEIPNSVTRIGVLAFYGCNNLKEVINLSNLTISKGSSGNGYVGYYADKVINIPNGLIEGDFIFKVVDGVNVLCNYLGNDTEIVLPENYKGENYVINEEVFKGNTAITSITIPASVTDIAENTFQSCTELKKVELNCATIGCWFSGNTSIKEIVLGNNVVSIADNAFRGCSGLTSITVADGNTVYDSRDNCNAIIKTATNTLIVGCKNSIIPNSVTSIGEWAFSYCSGLTSIVIPNSVTRIGVSAFYGCYGLTSITIPNSVTRIGVSAFYGCNNLKEVINCSILTISKGSSGNGYAGYYADKVINIPNGFIEGDFIFKVVDGVNVLCNYLGNDTEIILPENYKGENYVINEEVFKGNIAITSITIPASVTDIADNAFQGCTELKKVELNCATIGCWFSGNTSIKEIVLGNNVVSIADNAFRGCAGLASLTVGSKVANIGYEAFYGCTNLVKVFWLANTPPTGYDNMNAKINYVANNQYTDLNGDVVITQFLSSKFEVDGIVFIPISLSDRTCCVVDYNVTKNVSDVVVDETTTYRGVEMKVTDIMPYSFYNDAAVETLSLNNVGSIGKSAFTGCTSLSRLEIPECIASVGDHAFSDCSKLTDIVISERDNVLPLGMRLFDNCPLDSLYIDAGISYISEGEAISPFSENLSLKTVVITNVESHIHDYEFYNCTGLERAIVGDGVESIGKWAFSGCSGLTDFVFGSNLSTIGEEAFSDCSNMKNITGRAVMPPHCSIQALDDIDKWNCTLSVPSLYLVSYQNAEQWKEFLFFEELTTDDNYVTYRIDDEIYKILLIKPGERIVVPFVEEKEYYTFSWNFDGYLSAEGYPIMPDEDIEIIGTYVFTSIDGVKCENGTVKTIYDLQGRRVENPAKGIYIINGQKVVVK